MLHSQTAAPGIAGALAADAEVKSLSSSPTSYAVRLTTSKAEPRYIKGEFITIEPTQDAIPGDWAAIVFASGLGHVGRVISWNDEDIVIEQLNPPLQLTIDRAKIEESYIITGSFCDHPEATAAMSMHAMVGVAS